MTKPSKRSILLRRVSVGDGYVELIDFMGKGDLSVVNAARVSFGKRKDQLDERDHKLIRYLARHRHMSPFRHMQFSFRVHTSEVVCRQLYKHQVGCAFTAGEFRESATVWNEISGRYTQYEPEFHKVEKFRRQDDKNPQASDPHSKLEGQQQAQEIYRQSVEHSYASYQKLLDLGVCREQARLVLPVSFMNTLIWTASLEAVANFIRLRDHEGAQVEIRNLAIAIKELIIPICPISASALISETCHG